MKRNILIFGLLSGLIITLFMIYSTASCYNDTNFESNQGFGYAGMILAFSMIFIGIKNFRDKQNQGVVSFGKAFTIGVYIAFIASTVYVSVWLVEYYYFFPDFMEKYSAHVLKELKTEGASQLDIDEKIKEMGTFKELYQNPFFIILITYAEIFPLGLVISLISALILKRKLKKTETI